jgi:hypothetical protein
MYAHARLHVMESAMADPDWPDDCVAACLAEHYARVRLRESKKIAKGDRWQKVLLELRQQTEASTSSRA